jgi:hypothetical protein
MTDLVAAPHANHEINSFAERRVSQPRRTYVPKVCLNDHQPADQPDRLPSLDNDDARCRRREQAGELRDGFRGRR